MKARGISIAIAIAIAMVMVGGVGCPPALCSGVAWGMNTRPVAPTPVPTRTPTAMATATATNTPRPAATAVPTATATPAVVVREVTAPIRLKSGERLEGPVGGWLVLRLSEYAKIRGMTAGGLLDAMVVVEGASSCTVRRVRFEDAPVGAVRAYQAPGLVVEDCEFPGWGGAFSGYADSHTAYAAVKTWGAGSAVRRCVFGNGDSTAVWLIGERDMVVEDCVFVGGCRREVDQGVIYYKNREGKGVGIRRCIFRGLRPEVASAKLPCYVYLDECGSGVEVSDCRFEGAPQWALMWRGGQRVAVRDNVFAGCKVALYLWPLGLKDGSGFAPGGTVEGNSWSGGVFLQDPAGMAGMLGVNIQSQK